MLSGVTQTASKIVLGLAGVAVLGASANVVAILAGAVQRIVIQGGTMVYAMVASNENRSEKKASAVQSTQKSYVDMIVPYRSNNLKSLAITGFVNVVVGTAALYVAHRFCPSLVTNANSLLHHVVGIQFTPDHIPLTKLAGL